MSEGDRIAAEIAARLEQWDAEQREAELRAEGRLNGPRHTCPICGGRYPDHGYDEHALTFEHIQAQVAEIRRAAQWHREHPDPI